MLNKNVTIWEKLRSYNKCFDGWSIYIMDSVWEVAVCTAEVIIMYDFLIEYFKYRVKKPVSYIISALMAALSVSALLLTSGVIHYKLLPSAVLVLINFLFCIFLLNGRAIEKAFFSIFSVAVINNISALTDLMLSSIRDKEISHILFTSAHCQNLIIIINELLFFLICRIVLRLSGKKQIYSQEYFLMAGVPLFSIIAVSLLMPLAVENSGLRKQSFVFFLLLAMMNVLICSLFLYISQNNKLKNEYLMLELQYLNEQKNNREIRRLYEEVRSVRHDMKNHLLCISILAQRNKCDKILSYIQEFSRKAQDAERMDFFTGNDALDAILNTKTAAAEAEGITCRISIDDVELPLTQNDISVLLGNLMDNACEAAAKAEDKWIDVRISQQNESICIQVHNTVAGSVLSSNPFLRTSKSDQILHGYGTKNIRRIVRRYGGAIKYFEKDNVFMCDIFIPAAAGTRQRNDETNAVSGGNEEQNKE